MPDDPKLEPGRLLPLIVSYALGLAAAGNRLHALRNDGAVFVLMCRGDMLPNGEKVTSPYWAPCPAVPGTEAALEQQG